MIEERASKIAANLVRQFGRERFFSLSLPRTEDLEQIAQALRDSHGCTVVYDLNRTKISVHCPWSEPEFGELIEMPTREVVKISS